MSYELIETVEVGSGGAASIEFTSIPQDGTDLVLVCSLRSVSTGDFTYIKFNSDSTSSNYGRVVLRGTGSSVSSFGSDFFGGIATPLSTDTSNTFGNAKVTISNYAGSTNKSYSIDTVAENNATAADAIIAAGEWQDTSAITSIELAAASTDLAEYSTASLYKITAA